MLARNTTGAPLNKRNLYLPESLPNAMTEPENVIAPTNVPMNSSTDCRKGSDVRGGASPNAEGSATAANAMSDGRQTDQRVEEGDEFGHLRHLDSRREYAPAAPPMTSAAAAPRPSPMARKPRMLHDQRERGEDGDRHAGHAEQCCRGCEVVGWDRPFNAWMKQTEARGTAA